MSDDMSSEAAPSASALLSIATFVFVAHASLSEIETRNPSLTTKPESTLNETLWLDALTFFNAIYYQLSMFQRSIVT